MSHLLNTAHLKLSHATYFGHGSRNNCGLRMTLNPGDNKTKVMASTRFVTLTVLIEKLLHYFFKREVKWVKVIVQDGTRLTSILLNVNSICSRTLLSRKEVLSKSPLELSRALSDPAYIGWKYQKLNDFFPHITMINLDSRPDRIQTFQDHLKTIGESRLQYHRFSAVNARTLSPADIEKMSKSKWAQDTGKDDRAGRYGCYLSHLQVLRDARARNLPQILVLEDDVRFVTSELTGAAFQKTLKELPQNWGILLLGYYEDDPKKVKNYSEHLIQPGCSYSSHAYVVNASMYDRLIDILEAEIHKAETTPGYKMRACDVVVAEDISQKLAHEKLLFACKTNVAFQDESHSSITNTVDTAYKKELAEYNKKYQINTPAKNRTHTADGLPIMHPQLSGALYQMTHHLTTVFDRHNIRYWADGGTILGMERHQGLIPHDDDVDLWIYPEDIAKLRNPDVLRDLDALGLELADHWVGAKICAKQNHPQGKSLSINDYTYKSPNIDLFFSQEEIVNGERVYGFTSPKARGFWPDYHHKHTDVFDAQGRINKGTFGPIQLNTLQNPLAYCHRFYGPNCMFEAYIQYDHVNEQALERRPVQLSDFRLGYYEYWAGLPHIAAQR